MTSTAASATAATWDDVGRGLRAVAWERSAGQVVQVVLTVVVLLALPSPVRSSMPLVAIAARRGRARRRAAGAERDPAAAGRRGRGSGARRPATSATGCSPGGRGWASRSRLRVVVAGHAATFLIAARTAGITAPPSRMLPLALLVMLAMVLPSIGGWGPREGVAAWAFGAAGLGADQGSRPPSSTA